VLVTTTVAAMMVTDSRGSAVVRIVYICRP